MTITEIVSRVLPSTDELNELLVGIRQKYDIPEILPEEVELAEARRSSEYYDWEAIRGEIERELRARFQPAADSALGIWFQLFVDIVNNTPQIKAILTSQGIDLSEDMTNRLVEAIKKDAATGLGLVDKFYLQASERLRDYLMTGRPIEVPSVWFNLILGVTLAPFLGGDKLVVAIAHEASDPSEIAEEFRKKVFETFPEKPKLTEKDKETAEYLSMKKRGWSLEGITAIDVKRHPEAIESSIDDEDYDREFEKHKNTLNQRIIRLQADINQIAGSDKK